MNGYLLDTNVPSELIRSRPDPQVVDWVGAMEIQSLFLSVVSIGELRKGICLLPQGRRRGILEDFLTIQFVGQFGERILAVTREIGELSGAMAAERQLAGRPISHADSLIAATAAVHGLVLVTRNVRDFEGLGLAILNPWG